MNLKFTNSVLDSRCVLFNFIKTKRKTLRLTYQSQVQFCSQKENEPDGEAEFKKFLDKASPLKGDLIEEYVKEKKDVKLVAPEGTSVIMFPGQGNQFVGMGKGLLKYPVVNDMFAAANEILGYDLLKVCLEGPKEKLNQTEFCQPATLVCSLAALEKLKDERPWAINNCAVTCGYSLGEYSALVFAGCINFERAVKLVQIRAKAMSACCNKVKSGMMSVLCGHRSELSKALKDAIEHCKENGIENPVCSIATYLFTNCKVIAGHQKALNFIKENAKTYHLMKVSELAVSGAFHTTLMKDAAEEFKSALDNVTINDPLVKVYSNVNAKSYITGRQIKFKLPQQIYMPVKWEQTMQEIFTRPRGMGYPHAYECGPGSSLKTILNKTNALSTATCYSVKLL